VSSWKLNVASAALFFDMPAAWRLLEPTGSRRKSRWGEFSRADRPWHQPRQLIQCRAVFLRRGDLPAYALEVGPEPVHPASTVPRSASRPIAHPGDDLRRLRQHSG
jgi:hypothetical protein